MSSALCCDSLHEWQQVWKARGKLRIDVQADSHESANAFAITTKLRLTRKWCTWTARYSAQTSFEYPSSYNKSIVPQAARFNSILGEVFLPSS